MHAAVESRSKTTEARVILSHSSCTAAGDRALTLVPEAPVEILEDSYPQMIQGSEAYAEHDFPLGQSYTQDGSSAKVHFKTNTRLILVPSGQNEACT